MGSTNFALCWGDHDSSLVGRLNNLLKNNSLVDCTIAAEGQYIKVHRIVLSATSPYFQRLFDEGVDKHPIVFLKDVRFQLLMSILDFIYTGKVEIPEDQLEEFFVTAQSLEIQGLMTDIKNETVRKFPVLLNQLKGDDSSQSPATVDNDMTDFKEDCEILAEAGDDVNSSNRASPSGDHQYCADNGDPSSSPPYLIVAANSEASNTCEVQTECDYSDTTDLPETSHAVLIEKTSEVEEKPISKSDEAHPIIVKFQNKPVPKAMNYAEPTPHVSQHSPRKSPIVLSQSSKSSHKPGTIIIKPTGSLSASAVKKQNVVAPNQKHQAFLVGNKVLSVPNSVLLSGRKDWLQLPKPQHDDGKLYPCPECLKTFRKPSILANHRRTHTGEKPYQCPECGRMFNQSSNFRRHQRTHFEQRRISQT